MVMARNLEVTHHIDGNVKETKVLTEDINVNVKATKVLVEEIDGNVKASAVLTEDINDNVNATKVHIHDVDSNIKATKVLVEDINENVKEIEGVARGVDNSTRRFLCLHAHTHLLSYCISTQSRTSLDVCQFLPLSSSTVKNDICSQATRYKRNFGHGSLLLIPLSIIILHAKLNTPGQQGGLSKAAHSKIGRKVAPYYGSAGIVRLSNSFCLRVY